MEKIALLTTTYRFMTWIRALDWKKPIATDFFMEKNSVAGKEKCFGDKRANIWNVY